MGGVHGPYNGWRVPERWPRPTNCGVDSALAFWDRFAPVQRLLLLLLLTVFAAGTFMVRGWNLREVLIDRRIYFVDPDCYSRMTRARIVDSGAAWIVRKHEFENFPRGVEPHTTAPLDWLIVGLKWPLLAIAWAGGDALWNRALRLQTLDVAGALISPLLGAATCAWIGWALSRLRRLPRSGWCAAAFFFASSPILVHGTLLGRPDHQSLLLFFLAVALTAELRLAGGEETVTSRRRAAVGAGLAWGMACWVSYYEPLVLFVVVAAFWLLTDRARFIARECRAGWITFGAILLASVLIEGWRITVPAGPLQEAFARWSSNIGELKPASFELLSAWLGWLGLVMPLLLAGAAFVVRRRTAHSSSGDTAHGIEPERGERLENTQSASVQESRGTDPSPTLALTAAHPPAARAPALLAVLLALLLALAAWQVRWGYFLALVFALSLPWLFQLLRRAWIAWPVFIISLWPMARAWESQLFPDVDTERKRALHRAEVVALREIAEVQGERSAGAFAAPWWLSPPIAYWSGLPGLAGSSHESLRGILETARIYLAANAGEALPILRANGISWILSYPPDRIIANSAALLGVARPRKCLADELTERVLPEPWTLALIRERGVSGPLGAEFFQIWTVRPGAEAIRSQPLQSSEPK